METLFLSPGIQTGPFERYVQELCSMYVSAQLKEIAKETLWCKWINVKSS